MNLLYVKIALFVVSVFACLWAGDFQPMFSFIDAPVFFGTIMLCIILSVLMRLKRKEEDIWSVIGLTSVASGVLSGIINAAWVVVLGLRWEMAFEVYSVFLVHCIALGVFYGCALSFIANALTKKASKT